MLAQAEAMLDSCWPMGANSDWYLGWNTQGRGGGFPKDGFPAVGLYVYVPLGGEEKAGFGAQPRDSDAILPCPGDISNNIRRFGASNFKMPFGNPIPQLPGWNPGEGGGWVFFGVPGLFVYICMCPLGAKKKQGSGRSPKIPTPYCHAQGILATT